MRVSENVTKKEFEKHVKSMLVEHKRIRSEIKKGFKEFQKKDVKKRKRVVKEKVEKND